MSHNPAQSMLPNFSQLGLARTGMQAGEAAPAPAPHPDEFLESPDFFRAVLEQIKHVENLKDACEIAKTWCSLNSGRKKACAESDDLWKELARTLFTEYVPDPSEGVTWERHFYSLCNMDPVDRLVMAATARAEVLRAEVKEEMEGTRMMIDETDEDIWEEHGDHEEWGEADTRELIHQVLDRLSWNVVPEVTPSHQWWTDVDDIADVCIALTRYADELGRADHASVQRSAINVIIQLVTIAERARVRGPTMRQREQSAYLAAWLFRRRPPIGVVQELNDVHMGGARYMDHLSDWLYTTIQWGLFSHPRASAEKLHEHSDLVTTSLEALAHIAYYKDPNDDLVDWSEYATPRFRSGRTSCHFSAAALKHYLDYGNHAQKMLICKVIAHSLHVPNTEVASGQKPWERKLEFAKELAKTRAMDVLGTVGIGDLPLSRASVAAISSIAEQLAQHAWGRSHN